MTLQNLQVKENATVKSLNTAGELKHRLLSMGIAPGVSIILYNRTLSKSTVQIKINATLYTLRDTEAAVIEVEKN